MRTIHLPRGANHVTTTEDRPATSSELVAGIIAEFRLALGELRCMGSERLVRQGVSMSHLHVVSMLDRHGEMTMSHLAELLDVSLSNATGLVDRMAQRGLVERVRVPDDRRVVLVRVTDRGRRILDEMELLRDDLLQKVLGRLSPGQLDRVGQAIQDVHDAVAAVMTAEPDSFTHEHAHRATEGTTQR